MTRPIKITLWSIAGLIAVCLITVTILVNIVFSKDKLTPIVRDQLPNYISCQAELDNVELTFFSTFPKLALQLNNVTLINPKPGAQNDTLAHVKRLLAVLDAKAFLKDNAINIHEFKLNDAEANLFIASDSTSNFDIFISEDQKQDDSPLQLGEIKLSNIRLKDINVSLNDQFNNRQLAISGFNADVDGELHDFESGIKMNLLTDAAHLQYADSLISFQMNGLNVKECGIEIVDSLHVNLQVSSFFEALSVNMLGQQPMSFDASALHLNDVQLSLADKDIIAGAAVVLDTMSFQLEGEEPLLLQLSKASFSLPSVSCQEDYQAEFAANVEAATLNTKQDGLLLNKLPISLYGKVAANSDLTLLQLTDGHFMAAQEELLLSADMEKFDSLTTQVSAELSLASTTFARLLSLVPAAYKKSLKGLNLQGSIDHLAAKATVTLENDKPLDIDAFEINTGINNLRFHQSDSLVATARKMMFETRYPVENSKMSLQKSQQQKKRQQATQNNRRSRKALESSFMQAKFEGDDFHFEMHDSSNVIADLPQALFNFTLSDEILKDSLSLPFIAADFAFNRLTAQADTISLKTHNMSGSFTMADGMRGMKQYYEANFESIDLDIAMGESMKTTTGPIIIEASSVFDANQKDLLLKYNPLLNVTLSDGMVSMSEVPFPFEIPSIDFDFNLGRFLIREGQFRYGDSDFNLTGEVNNLREYLKKESDLLADLKLKSKQTHVYQLMDLVEQMAGPVDTTAVQNDTEDYINTTLREHQTQEAQMTEINGADPFMVPLAIDLTLTTDIDKTLVGKNIFSNLGGKLSIKDGNLILEEMGFSSKAARMQLTALYRSPQKNNLFLGANFHLLDIDVADLIQMVPAIDSIVPMLRSFEGKGEFHFSAETNLFGNYDPKMSTLKATGSIEGKDLTLLDGETFSKMAKYLMFNKQTRNKIDTLSVEMAVNRKKMTLYPMLIGMDKYQAVISGSHSLTDSMPFNYHVSITDCPVVGGHVGLDIEGNMEHPEAFSYRLVGCKYANLYKPEKRNVTQEQTLELKSLISNALKKTVKEQ